MELILDKINMSVLTLILVAGVYWVMEWIKLALKDKLKEVYIQPIALCVGTILTGFIMYTYNFVPVQLGPARWEIVNYFFQGGLITALAGVIYDKFLDKD
ncbi:MAG: hypothetical protein WCX79_04805 [Candidatus Paceibacterota bacterium]|jgi:hypothetical protein